MSLCSTKGDDQPVRGEIHRYLKGQIVHTIVILVIAFLLCCGASQAAPAPQASELVSIKHAEVAPIIPFCKALFPSLGYEAETAGIRVTGDRRDIEFVRQFVATLDVPPRPVLLDVRVVSLSEEAEKHLGIRFPGGGGDPVLRNGFFAALDPTTLREARSLAGRYALARPFHAAKVFVGDTMPLAYFDVHRNLLQLKPVDIGVGFSITPLLYDDGYIVLDIVYRISTLTESFPLAPPMTHETGHRISIRLRDGESTIFGNLLNEWTDAHSDGTSLCLKELPVLGEMFRNPPERLYVTLTPTLEP